MMRNKIVHIVILSVLMLTAIAGCSPSRTYTEGILATDYRFMSPEELEKYGARIDQEINRMNREERIPAGVTREMYLEDLRARRETVKTRLMMIEHFKQKDAFDDRYPSP